MTREEIKDELYRMLSDVVNGGYPKRNNTQRGRYREAVGKAIEALQQEPCEDAISRQAAINVAIDAVDDWDGGCNLSREEYIRKALERLRPVTPQYTDAEIQKMQDLEFAEIQKAYEIGKAENPNKWIPVSVRLPNFAGAYLVTRYFPNNVMNPTYLVDACFFDGTDTWHNDNRINHERKYLTNVVAWLEEPEPYKASPTGEEVKE